MGTKHNEVILDSCGKLTVDRFDKISSTNDLFWLIERYEGTQMECEIDLKEVWQNLLDEFSELMGNDAGKVILGKQSRLYAMQAKYQRNAMALKIYYSGNMADGIKEDLRRRMQADGFDPNTGTPETLSRKLKGLQTKIKWESSALKTMLPEQTQCKKVHIVEQLLSLERVLELSYALHAEELKVDKYAFLIKAANAKTAKNGK